MTLTLKARLRDRIRQLPEVADHNCGIYGIWIRRPTLDGRKIRGSLQCKVCGRP